MTDTAATPEELAASLAEASASFHKTGLKNGLATWAYQHGPAILATAEAQRAEIERLTKENARLGWSLAYAEEGRDDFKARATTAEAALSASLERERVVREALRKCISPYAGYAIQNDKQAVDVMKGFYAHIREVDGIARAALQPQETADER